MWTEGCHSQGHCGPGVGAARLAREGMGLSMVGSEERRVGAGDVVWGDTTQRVPVAALRISPCHPGSTLP